MLAFNLARARGLTLPLATAILALHVGAQEATLTPSDTPRTFGRSVSLDGNTAVVGATQALLYTGSGSHVGAVYVFVEGGGAWTEETRLVANDAADADQFGWSVGLSNDTLVVGSPLDDHAAGSDSGSAYVFVRAAGAWQQEAKLVAGDGRQGDRFGSAVAVLGDTIVVGAPEDDGITGLNAGSSYVFVRSGGTWTQQAKISPSDLLDDDRFGTSVAVSGESIVIGAPGTGNWGGAHIFTRSGGIWIREARLDGVGGASVSILGDAAAFGLPWGETGPGDRVGCAFVFVRSGTTWTQQALLFALDGQEYDEFGCSVSLSGGMLLVGSSSDDNYQSNSGSGYVFARAGTVWVQQEKLAAELGGLLGISAVLQGDRALLGATATGGNGLGSAFLWSVPAGVPGPVAMFTGSPLRGRAPLTVQFTDLSTGTITGRLWDFGNGFLSTGENPVFTYQAPGVYAVSLTVSGPDGVGTHTEQAYIEVLANGPWIRDADRP